MEQVKKHSRSYSALNKAFIEKKKEVSKVIEMTGDAHYYTVYRVIATYIKRPVYWKGRNKRIYQEELKQWRPKIIKHLVSVGMPIDVAKNIPSVKYAYKGIPEDKRYMKGSSPDEYRSFRDLVESLKQSNKPI